MMTSAALLACLLAAGPARAEFTGADAGTSGANFLKLGIGARAVAMGGAVTASVSDPTAMRWNPAGLAAATRYTLSTMHGSHLGVANHEYLGAALPSSALGGVLGVDLAYLSLGVISRTDASGNEQGSFKPYNMAFGLGYARPLGPLRLGAAGRFIQTKIVGSASTFALDAGAQYRFSDFLQLGGSVHNLGPGLKVRQEKDPLPLLARAGAAMILSTDCLFEFDLSFPRDNQPALHAGVDYRLYRGDRLWLMSRLGYTSQTLHVRGFAGPSFGLGLSWSRFALDYSLSPTGELGLSHVASLKLAWGAPGPAEQTEK